MSDRVRLTSLAGEVGVTGVDGLLRGDAYEADVRR